MRGQVNEYEDLFIALKEDLSLRMCEDKGAGEDTWTLEGKCKQKAEGNYKMGGIILLFITCY